MTPRLPMSEAPTDATPIIVEVCRYSGVPETGGYEFLTVARSEFGWCPVGKKGTHYGESSLLGWWPAETDVSSLTLSPRKNWNFIPSNGTEGEAIYNAWCADCIRERAVREDYDHAIANGLGCDILARSMAFGIGDPHYPTEWTYDRVTGEPKCTARVKDVGQEQPERCKDTLEMFPETTASSTAH